MLLFWTNHLQLTWKKNNQIPSLVLLLHARVTNWDVLPAKKQHSFNSNSQQPENSAQSFLTWPGLQNFTPKIWVAMHKIPLQCRLSHLEKPGEQKVRENGLMDEIPVEDLFWVLHTGLCSWAQLWGCKTQNWEASAIPDLEKRLDWKFQNVP